jgi:hypothetical protein
LTTIERVERCISTIVEIGERDLRYGAYTLNIDFGPRIQETLARDANINYVRDEILKAIRGVVGEVPYVGVLEISDKGAFHVHGAILVPPQARRELEDLLARRFGGGLKYFGYNKVALLDTIDCARGWATYILKNAKRTTEALGTDNIWFVSRPLKKLVQSHSKASRAP